MSRHLFLTGPAGCGKSRLIREALGDRLAGAGGFITGPVVGPEGYAVAYALRPAAAAAGVEGLERRIILDCGTWPPRRDNEVFRTLGARLLQEAAFYPYAVLDEIGGFETVIPQFRQALEELLNSGVPLLGALKTPEDAAQWQALYGLGERFTALDSRLRDRLAQDPDGRILDLARTDEDEVRAALRDWVGRYL